MLVSDQGRKIHSEAAKLREQGKHLESLKLDDEAMITYQKDGDLLGLSEVLADRSIVLRHLYDETEDKSWLFIARAEMEASVDIAKKSDDKAALAVPLYNLAKVVEVLGDYHKAVDVYKEAISNMENNPPASHDRPAVLADMKIHLNYSEYKSGEKSALDRMIENIKMLEESDERQISQYNYDVWLSGAHMSAAEMLREDDPEKARKHLQKAREVIDSNPELTIRKEQWEKLSKQFD